MFFDYPADEDELRSILDSVCAQKVHFMNKTSPKSNPDEVLKKLSGMLKFVCSSKDGSVDVCYLSSLLGTGDECLNEAVKLFAECGIIKINSFSDNILNLDFVAPKGLSEIKARKNYPQFCQLLAQTDEYHKYLLECDVSELEQLVLNN